VARDGLTVAVTGPTGDLGIALVSRLERSRGIKRVVAMARRPFDPAERGWRKTEYRRGDVQDRASVRAVVEDADVVVHLAFSILGEGAATRAINVEGSRNVFEAAVESGAQRICYASSIAAYGFHDDNPTWIREDVPPRGTPEHFYSQQKAEVEQVLRSVLDVASGDTTAYVFRPCIVAGPEARMPLEEMMPYIRLSERVPDAVMRLLSSMPILRPVVPDTGLRFQLVHEDDVAQAFVAAVHGRGAPGPYNLAGSGTITMSDIADALGWYSISIPELTVEAAAEVLERLPAMPEWASWIQAARKPLLVKTDRARKELRWRPKHSTRATLRELVAGYRAEQRAR
jgi:nucleoside-diphosphate-sugar epimerase